MKLAYQEENEPLVCLVSLPFLDLQLAVAILNFLCVLLNYLIPQSVNRIIPGKLSFCYLRRILELQLDQDIVSYQL